MPTSQAQTPYITPYIIHQHFGYGDPSVNNYRYSYFSSATRSAFPHSGGVAHPITTQYHHGFARDTLIGIITNLILLKPNVSPSPIRARRSRAHDPTFDKLGNVWGGRDIAYINTTVGKVKGFMVATLKAGQPLFFGPNVAMTSNMSLGIMDLDLFTSTRWG